jgi:hypothetical protein
VTNEFAADLQGLTEFSIVQETNEYGAINTYKITFTPFSSSKIHKTTLLFSYPATIEPDTSAVSGGCTVKAGATTSVSTNCKKIDGARIFKITEAIPSGYIGTVVLSIKLKNPTNNWGSIGFKLKTYEAFEGEEYLIDMLETNDLIPSLMCYAPC